MGKDMETVMWCRAQGSGQESQGAQKVDQKSGYLGLSYVF